MVLFLFYFLRDYNVFGTYTIWKEVITENEIRLISGNLGWGWYGKFNWEFAFKAELDLDLENQLIHCRIFIRDGFQQLERWRSRYYRILKFKKVNCTCRPLIWIKSQIFLLRGQTFECSWHIHHTCPGYILNSSRWSN